MKCKIPKFELYRVNIDDFTSNENWVDWVELSLLQNCAFPENIYTPPMEGFFCFAPPVPPGNSSLASYFASKILTFKTPLPLGISDDLPWGGYQFFLKLHIPSLMLVSEVLLSYAH